MPVKNTTARDLVGFGLTLLALLVAACDRPPPRRPNIVLITLDTTRADRLGCYGYERPTSPKLDAFASESIVYTRAISPSSWTLPAHASLFTGKFTSSHGARYDPEGPLRLTAGIEGPEAWDLYRARGLATDEQTLASILQDAGYVTAAVVGGPWMKKPFGLDKGFDHYDDDQIHTVKGRLADEVTTAALKWTEAHREDEFFLFLNYYDPHGPYSPPEPFTFRFFANGAPPEDRQLTVQDRTNLYDAEILYMDLHVGRFLKGVERLSLQNDTLFVITADHGELLGEHGKNGHGTGLYQEEIHVPLIIKYPGGETVPGHIDDPIQLVDIAPLILHHVGFPVPASMQGGTSAETTHPILAEAYPLPYMSKEGDWRVLLDGLFKLYWNSLGNHKLVNLADDPKEKLNLVEQEPERAERMQSLLNAYLDSLPEPKDAGPPVELDEETGRALKNLGYVQ